MKARLIQAAALWMAFGGTFNLDIVHGESAGWTSIGPRGGTVYALAIDPDNHSIVYAGTNAGVLKSTDAGGHWRAVNAGLPLPLSADVNGGPYIHSLAIDPRNTATLYAGVSFFGDELFAEPRGVGVYRSDDGGNSWHAANVGDSGIPLALAIDPVTPTTLYAASQTGPLGPAHLFKSIDGGGSWSIVLDPPSIGFPFASDLAIDPQAPATVYAATLSGVFKTTDGGATWAAMNVGLTNPVTAFAIHPADSSVLYAGTRGGGVFKSTNAGASWTPINTGLTSLLVTELAIAVRSPDTLSDVRSPDTLYVGLETGAVFKTTNQGAEWTPVNTGLVASRISKFVFDPEKPGIVYAASERNGVFKTVNGGNQWSQTALSTIRAFSIAVDSTAAKAFVGEDRGRVHRRIGEGKWTFVDLNPNPNVGAIFVPGAQVTALAIDPLVPTTGYAGSSVYKTTDGGAHWSPVLATTRIFTVALDPVVPSTVYAGGGGGAFKSVDSGATWTAITTGLGGLRLRTLAVDPQTPTTLYAGMQSGLFKSVDGGSNWAPAMEGLPQFFDVAALAIDPQTTSTIYAGFIGGTVFKSTDGGASWSQSSDGLPARPVLALAVNPAAPSVVFAGTYGGGVFKSVDGGASWSPMNEQLPNLLIRALTIDASSATLYAGTDGGGVAAIAAPADVRDDGRDQHD